MDYFNKENLRDLLLNSYDYETIEVDATVTELLRLSEDGRAIFREYIESGVLPSREQNGLSLRKMRTQFDMEMPDIALIIIYDGIQRHLASKKL